MMVAFAIVMSLAIYSGQSHSDELSLGLWTYHFDRDVKDDECTNEVHNLVGYRLDNGLTFGGYDNSHCRESYFVGFSQDLYKRNNFAVGWSAGAVTGYPSSMHVVDGLIIIPNAHMTYTIGGVGIKIIYIPNLLKGAGLIYEF
jgi:hypothetical protein